MTHFSAHEDSLSGGVGANPESLAVGLGWFSIALGVAELAAPRALARFIGVAPTDSTVSVLRAYGARELGTGLAILAQPRQSAWLWGRVAGDALDLATLGAAMGSEDSQRGRLTMASAAVMGVTVLDVLCAQRLDQEKAVRGDTRMRVRVKEQITINQPIERVYGFWRNLENLPRVMSHLESVESLGQGRSRWRAKGPGMSVVWDAETIQDRENEMISWRSLEGAAIENSGSVEFRPAPGARGTEVHVQLEYSPPAGALGRGVAWLMGRAPEQQLSDDLRRFKQLMEAGEVTRSDGPALWRAAQPAANAEQARDFAGV
jgi:uncharacterized membrane protein